MLIAAEVSGYIATLVLVGLVHGFVAEDLVLETVVWMFLAFILEILLTAQTQEENADILTRLSTAAPFLAKANRKLVEVFAVIADCYDELHRKFDGTAAPAFAALCDTRISKHLLDTKAWEGMRDGHIHYGNPVNGPSRQPSWKRLRSL